MARGGAGVIASQSSTGVGRLAERGLATTPAALTDLLLATGRMLFLCLPEGDGRKHRKIIAKVL